MEIVPDLWRTEVLHPLSVHFPIAILIMATIFKIFSLWNKGYFLHLPGTILLAIGTITGWIAIYTGNLADGIVARTICDPTILKDHENAAYSMMWIFTAAAAVDLITFVKAMQRQKFFLKVLIVMGLLAGSGFLFYTGHLGASLVYNQAAGVYTPSPDCAEF